MSKKKTIYFVSHNKNTAEHISGQLNYFLGEYVNVKAWHLECEDELLSPEEYNICLITSIEICKNIFKEEFSEDRFIVAKRALNIENIDKIFELHRGTTAIMVGNTYNTAYRGIELLNKIGIDYLKLTPFYPGSNTKIPKDAGMAITTGSPHLIPSSITKVVDLGVVGLDLSTYVNLIMDLKLPRTLIEDISQHYINEIYDLSLRIQRVAQNNDDLKRRFEVILNTASDAIVAIDQDGYIILINQQAENLLRVNNKLNIGKKFEEIFPQLSLDPIFNNKTPIRHEIINIRDNDFVVNANPVIDKDSLVEAVVIVFHNVGEVQKIETKIRRELKRKENTAKYHFDDITGSSNKLNQVISLASQFSKTDLTILIEGESGTGKELLAQAIHNESNRWNERFVAINLAALPETLVDSELFGYEEGAFTGAKKSGKPGLFEEAHNGTIFLDEIGDASLGVQKRLLRVLEERETRRVGGRYLIPIDVRVIAATNKNLLELVEKGDFRDDLFYRICTIPLQVPALRQRKKDVLDLANYFSRQFYNTKTGFIMDDSLQTFLLNYSWPGNIRELENVIKYICNIKEYETVAQIEHLPLYLFKEYEQIENNSKVKEKHDDQRIQEEIKIIAKELNNEGSLSIYSKVLKELKISSTFGKGVGRNYLRYRLEECGEEYSDYELRKILDTLKTTGFIDQGRTRQGSTISPLGERFLEYVSDG